MTYHTSTLFGNECLDNKNAFSPVELQYQEMLSVKKVLVIQLLYNRHNVSVVLIEDKLLMHSVGVESSSAGQRWMLCRIIVSGVPNRH